MSKSMYVLSTEPDSGKYLVTLGIIDVLLKKYFKILYFRPVSTEINSLRSEIINKQYGFNNDIEDGYVYTETEASELIDNGDEEVFLDKILEKYKTLEKKYDFILIDGIGIENDNDAIRIYEMNIDIIKTLLVPVVTVFNGFEKDENYMFSLLKHHEDFFYENKINNLFNIFNKTEKKKYSIKSLNPIYFIPYHVESDWISVHDLKEKLNAQEIYDYGREFNIKPVSNFIVCAMRIENMLDYLVKDNTALIVPFDRSDILLGAINVVLSTEYSNISGIIVTGKGEISKNIKRLIDGMKVPISIISVEEETYKVALKIKKIKSSFTLKNVKKINIARDMLEKYVNAQSMLDLIHKSSKTIRTPKMFLYELAEIARNNRRKIVLSEGEEPRILKAAEKLIRRELVEIILLGNESIIQLKIVELGLDLKNITIIDPLKDERFLDYSHCLYELRKHKGMNMDMAKDLMASVNYFGTMMIYMGDADGMVSGAIHSTADTIRPALQIIKTKPESSIVSSVFLMCLPDRVLVYGDCAVIPNPSAEELSYIAIDSEKTARDFNINPKVALLSYSTGSSGKGEEVEKVKDALKIIKEKKPEMIVDGPIQYDAAVSKEVGLTKMPDSKVAGNATVLIFPDLNTGNNTYKAVQRETDSLALGPVLQGLKKPINDLSRGCSVDDIVNTVLLTVAQCE